LLPEIDITLVATRRPDLVRRTLQSFYKGLLSRLSVHRLFVNVDPRWGDVGDDLTIEQTCRRFVPDTVVFRPESPCFGGAVKRLWSLPTTDWFLHLEDDWRLVWPVDLRALEREMQIPTVAQIALRRTKNEWRDGVMRGNRFVTGPSFVNAAFGRMVSEFMTAELDPEKQFGNGLNPALTNAVRPFSICSHGGRFGARYVTSLGHKWRKRRGIDKTIVNGISVWSEPNQTSTRIPRGWSWPWRLRVWIAPAKRRQSR
jgi:hypothetical protein